MKMSILGLHDKVSILTFMLDKFMKEMKGMVVKDVFVEEEVEEKKEEAAMEEAKEKAEKKEKNEKEEDIFATPIQTVSPPTVEVTPITTLPDKPKVSMKGRPGPKSSFYVG